MNYFIFENSQDSILDNTMGIELLPVIFVLTPSRYGEAYGLGALDLMPFLSPQTNNSLQVDSQGKVYVLSGNELLRLSRDLQLEQNVSLPDFGATLSLSPDGQRLLVCVNGMMSRSCFIYDPSDLTTQPVTTAVSIVGAGAATATSFSTEGSFYVGSYVVLEGGSSVAGRMRLSNYIYGDGSGTPVIRSRDFDVISVASFVRRILFGSVTDMYAYFVVVDFGRSSVVAGFRVLRVVMSLVVHHHYVLLEVSMNKQYSVEIELVLLEEMTCVEQLWLIILVQYQVLVLLHKTETLTIVCVYST